MQILKDFGLGLAFFAGAAGLIGLIYGLVQGIVHLHDLWYLSPLLTFGGGAAVIAIYLMGRAIRRDAEDMEEANSPD